jgi:hypothetical protein
MVQLDRLMQYNNSYLKCCLQNFDFFFEFGHGELTNHSVDLVLEVAKFLVERPNQINLRRLTENASLSIARGKPAFL